MKTVAMILTALTLTAPVTAHAVTGKPDTNKNNCLLYSENCPPQADTILERIDKLQSEITKGAAVYFPAEVDRLKSKLEEYQGHLDVLNGGGGGD